MGAPRFSAKARITFVVGAVLLVAACSSVAPSNGDADGRTKPASDQSYVDRQIARYSAIPVFTPPGGPVDAAKVKGKTVLNFPDSSANPYAANVAAGERAAAKVLGINYIYCSAQGQVAQWVQCMNQAVARRVDLVFDFSGVNPASLGPQIQAAKAANIPVIGTGTFDRSQTPDLVSYSVPNDYRLAGRLMADWVIKDTAAAADTLVVTSNDVPATGPIVAGLKDEFDAHCGACKASFVDVPVADWATRIQSVVQSALLKDPKIDYIVPIYDSMTEFAIPAIMAVNRAAQVHIATYNGTPFVLKDLQQGDIVRMDVGVDEDWLGWAYLDAAARVLSGSTQTVVNEDTVLRVFTRANVREAGDPPQPSTGYGDSYLAGYRRLWGAS